MVGSLVSAIDPASSVPVSTQLRSSLEFGIASGDLPDGHRLPSVRALARHVGLSPVTVSSVYAALRKTALVEGRSGSGTYVRTGTRTGARLNLAEIDVRIAELVAFGKECGLEVADLALRVSMAQPMQSRPLSILMVGNFPDATRAYADAIRPSLQADDSIEPVILSDLMERGTEACDLILAPRTLLGQIAEHLPGVTTVGVTLIPNEATRVGLASLPPDARVAAYSIFPGFVTIMRSGIRRFAPHVAEPDMILRGDADTEARLARAQVVIYASGAENLRDSLRPGQTAFEYRHTPDAQSIRNDVLPAVAACRLYPSPGRKAAE